jgi:predicted nuclease of predicted toxin-antitoxin system
VKGFLFDENLPRRITIGPSLPIQHIKILGNSPSDLQIWTYAKDQSLVIVTKDADFSNRIMSTSPPPWVVHLRFGNMRLSAFHAILTKVWPSVEALLPANKLICVYKDRIESFRN